MAEEGATRTAEEGSDSTLTYEQLYSDLLEAATTSATLPEGAFSMQDFIDDSKLPPTTARRFLGQRVRSGILGTRRVTVDGHQQRYYWFIGDAQLGGNSDTAK